MKQLLEKVRKSSLQMGLLTPQDKNAVLRRMSQLLVERSPQLLAANQKDLKLQKGKISDSLYQRLKLDENKIKTLAQGCEDLAKMEDPVGKILARTELDSGLVLEKVSTPLGVVAVIFESRPDVIPQILALVLKSGNAALLKGGKEAKNSNTAFMVLVKQLNKEFSFLPSNWANLLEGRSQVDQILKFPQFVDLVIPRGSNQLVQTIQKKTKIPVLGHADGICHFYVHAEADLGQALSLVMDSKTQYPAACNSIETLLVDVTIGSTFLPVLKARAEDLKLQLLGCPRTRKVISGVKAATEKDFRKEWGDLHLSVKIVKGLDQAVEHINSHSSHHTDGIATRNKQVAEEFLIRVDSAGVYWNASTRFADGYRYGFGAEVGISTNRLHARGPVGLEGLTSYKYKLRGQGQVVADYVGPDAKPFTHKKQPTPKNQD